MYLLVTVNCADTVKHTCVAKHLVINALQRDGVEDLLGLGLFDIDGHEITAGAELLLQQQQDLLDGFNDIRAVDSATAAATADNTNATFYGGISSNSAYRTLSQSSSSSPKAVAAAEAAAAHYGLNLAAHVRIYQHCTTTYCLHASWLIVKAVNALPCTPHIISHVYCAHKHSNHSSTNILYVSMQSPLQQMPLPQQYQLQNDSSNGANNDDDPTDDAEWLGDVLNADDHGNESNSSAADDDAIDDSVIPLPSPLPMVNFNM
jgi:hypothetical protein